MNKQILITLRDKNPDGSEQHFQADRNQFNKYDWGVDFITEVGTRIVKMHLPWGSIQRIEEAVS